MSRNWGRRLSLGALVCFVALATACGSWRVSGKKVVGTQERVRGGGVADGTLDSSGHVTSAGTVRVALTMRGQCYKNVETREKIAISEYKKTSKGTGFPLTLGIIGAIGVGVGLPVTLAHDTSYWWMPVGGAALYIYALTTILSRKGRSGRRYRTRYTTRYVGTERVPSECSPQLQRRAQARMPRDFVLRTPWGDSVAGRRRAAGVDFAVNWSRAGIDPLRPDFARLRGAWRITDRSRRHAMDWHPSRQDLHTMVRVAGMATGTDISVATGGAPPMLVVKKFAASPPLSAGLTSTLTLSVANQGQGDAYRFSARTKSSHATLHGVRFSFGRVPAGSTVTRTARVTMPRGDRGGEALVLLAFDEANRNAPERYSQNFSIGAARRPQLVAKCSFVRGVDVSNPRRLVADAGKQLRLRCVVGNRGVGRAVSTTMRASIARGRAKRSQAKTIRPHQRATFDVLLQVPRAAKLGQGLLVAVDIAETSFNVSTRQTYTVYVGKPAICTGTISRATFNRKIGDLRKLRANGDITEKQFKDYEAQLVGCLE